MVRWIVRFAVIQTRLMLLSPDEELLLPEIERQQKVGREVVFRANGAFCQAGDLRGSEGARGEVSNPHLVQRKPGARHRGAADAVRCERAKDRFRTGKAAAARTEENELRPYQK